MRPAFSEWLSHRLQVTSSRIAEAKRLESNYGDLDRLYDRDKFASLLEELAYSKEDERNSRPNPARFQIAGAIYNSLNTYRCTLRSYARFRAEEDRLALSPVSGPRRWLRWTRRRRRP